MTVPWHYNSDKDLWELRPELKREEVEEVKCAEFGCGTSLTPGEQLFGDRCIRHSKDRKKKLVDVIDKYL